MNLAIILLYGDNNMRDLLRAVILMKSCLSLTGFIEIVKYNKLLLIIIINIIIKRIEEDSVVLSMLVLTIQPHKQ